MRQYTKDATETLDIGSMPAGARVSYKPYEDLSGLWIELRMTPIKAATTPLSMTRFIFLDPHQRFR